MRYRRLQLIFFSTLSVAAFSGFAPAVADVPSELGIRIQQDALIWTTDYEGRIDGKLGDETAGAIKKFQARIGRPQTGTLTDSEVVELVKQGNARKAAAGFRQYTDARAGVSVGVPEKLLPAPRDVPWGSSWSDRGKGLAIDTMRFTNEVSLRQLYDKLLKINNRTIAYQRYVDDGWFVIAAFEKEAAIYVRAELVRAAGRPDEIRGFSIWMSDRRPDWYQSIAPAMLSSFRSNTDTTSDVLPVASTGGPMTRVDRSVTNNNTTNSNGVKLPRNDPPAKIEPIIASGQASSATPCYKGLGECPTVLTAK